MKKSRSGDVLELRTRQFTISILKLSLKFTEETIPAILTDNLIRTSLGIGASYFEYTKATNEQISRNYIQKAFEDAKETIFWLKVLDEFKIVDPSQIFTLINLCTELLITFDEMRKDLRKAG